MRRVSLALSILSFLVAVPAFAGPPGAPTAAPTATAEKGSDVAKTDQAAAAQELFDKALLDIQAGRWADACTKLEASNKAAWAPGTTINLADCYEHVGKLASAWAKFLEAEPHFRNRTPPDPRADIAKQRAEALSPKLSRITVEVPEAARVDGLVIERDGDEVDKGQWGTGLPVDPGKHVIEARADGRKAWRWEAEVSAGGGTVTVKVPVLEIDRNELPQKKDVDTGMPLQRKIAIGAGAAGVAGLVVGGVLGGLAMGKVGDSNAGCTKIADGTFQCTPDAAKMRDDAKGLSMISTIGFVAGGVLAAGGVVLWLTAPSSAPAKDEAPPAAKTASRGVWIAPVVGPTSGLSVGGHF